MRLRFWHLVLLVVAVCGAAIGVLDYQRSRLDDSAGSLLRRLPQVGAVRLVVDVAALRSAGLLEVIAGTKASEESEYKDFVESSGFNYREDLDLVCATFKNEDSFFILKARFDWSMLHKYAIAEGGNCSNGFCSVPSGRSGRNISFYPLKPNVLAIAVTRARQGAYDITQSRDNIAATESPDAPVWLSVSPELLLKSDALPAGIRGFLRTMQGSRRVVVGIGPSASGIEATMRGNFTSQPEAATAAEELKSFTDLATNMMKREKQTPNPADWSGIITSGVFHAEGATVIGKWPISRGFLEGQFGEAGK